MKSVYISQSWIDCMMTTLIAIVVNMLFSAGEEDKEMKEVTLQATGRLKEALKEERQNSLKLQAEIELLKVLLNTLLFMMIETHKTWHFYKL